MDTPPTTRSTYINSAYLPFSDDDSEDEVSVEDMLAELRKKIETSETQLCALKDLRAAAERDAADARQVSAPFDTLMSKLLIRVEYGKILICLCLFTHCIMVFI